MAVLRRWILVLTLLLAAGPRLWAASPADRAFDAAVKAFQDTFYARAETQLADFCQKNPTSPHLPQAILLQAQARLELTNYPGAIQLLTANLGQAGTNIDQYLFWLGNAHSRKEDWRAASDTFARLAKEYPASTRTLEATLGEAAARAALARTDPAEWSRVIGLLQQTNSLFQEVARTNAASDLLPRGYLLLSEAQLATKDYRGAEATLQPLAKRLLNPKLAWQWQYLLCRIQLADGRTNAALQGTTNLLAAAVNAAQTNLFAESAAFQANLLERVGRTNDALAAYQRNLAEGIPAERQRQALLKITEMSLAQDDIPQATQMLDKFLAHYPDAASADLALLTLGELRLRQHEAGAPFTPPPPATTNAAPATNHLQLAVAAFESLVKRFPQSPLFGKAQLELGLCYLRQGRLAAAETAFQAAVERPLASKDLANAYFRLADTQFQQAKYPGAIKSYQALREKFANAPDVRTNLFEPALYQTVRAALAATNLIDATNALQDLRAWHPRSPSTASAVLLIAQDFSRRGDPASARKLLTDFDKAIPDAPLRAERQLAVAATWEQEKNWAAAIAQYESWLASFTNHEARARAEYCRARDTSFLPGGMTNALALFTNFVARFPTNEFAPLAQMRVADYYFDQGKHVEAELNYKLLFQNTNWPPSELTYEAQISAGRAAVARQRWDAARDYFTGLYNNTNGPSLDQRLQALFEYGQTLMLHLDPADTNQLANCEQATRVFARVWEEAPTNRLAIPALLEKAKCYKDWALVRQQYDSLTNALNVYDQVLRSPQADVPARSEAKVGLAITLEKWAEHKSGPERTALLEQALSNCVDVVYGTILRDNERPHEWWTKEAGVKGLALADALQAWSQEVRLFQRLTNSVWPQLPEPLLRQVKRAQENLDREKANN